MDSLEVEKEEVLPYVTIVLIAVNVLVFCLSLVFPKLPSEYGLMPSLVSRGKELWTLFTLMFLHAGFLHLGGNMVTLVIFGSLVERKLKHARFISLYITAGLLASILVVLLNPDFDKRCLGASGAVSGVVGACVFVDPLGGVPVWFFLLFIFSFLDIFLFLLAIGICVLVACSSPRTFFIKFPAFLFIFPWILSEWILYSLVKEAGFGPLGIEAHMIGFAAGALLAMLFKILERIYGERVEWSHSTKIV